MATKLSNPAQTMILLVILASIVGLGCFLLWKPTIVSIEDINKQARDSKTTLQKIDDMLGDRPRSLLSTPEGEPVYIKVQHCLISFEGKLEGKSVTRTQAEAEQLALELFEKAKGGADFGEIVAEFTDDAPPGIYQVANEGYPAAMTWNDLAKKVFLRKSLVREFGNVSFKLKVGEIGIADYDAGDSPFGWHVIKRLE